MLDVKVALSCKLTTSLGNELGERERFVECGSAGAHGTDPHADLRVRAGVAREAIDFDRTGLRSLF